MQQFHWMLYRYRFTVPDGAAAADTYHAVDIQRLRERLRFRRTLDGHLFDAVTELPSQPCPKLRTGMLRQRLGPVGFRRQDQHSIQSESRCDLGHLPKSTVPKEHLDRQWRIGKRVGWQRLLRLWDRSD